MKKLFFLIIALVFTCGMLSAAPVDANSAKTLGQKFVQANFDQNRQASGLDLVYTVTSDNGVPCLYVFNVDNSGFVIVSASDLVRPILGYSEEGAFDVNNIASGLNYYLGVYQSSISYAIENLNVAEDWVATEWANLEKYGKVKVSRNSRSVEPLLSSKWNQDSPYNLYAPAAPSGPDGRCYAGCVATAMSTNMHYWGHPAQGTGSHSYNCPGYGQLSANFGETDYHFEIMPNTLSGATQEQIEAVALLMYHCGVSVNMGFAPDGSGAFSADVPGALSAYFSYAPSQLLNRQSYTLEAWNSMLKEAFDCGRPVYYSGQSPEGGHAFNCDGYDDNDLFHFNFGWGGSGNGYFAVDAIDYNTQQGAIMNMMPQQVYNNTAQAPTNFSVTPTTDDALSASVTWTNPTKTLNNSNISAIDQIVLTRDGEVAYVLENPTPGETVTITDDNVPCFNIYDYKVYAVIDGAHGNNASYNGVTFGPTCEWSIVMTSTAFQGWRGGKITIYNTANKAIASATMTSSTATTVQVDVPLGNVSFGWTSGTDVVNNMTFNIKDATNTTVYQFSGTSTDLTDGIFLTANNDCGSGMQSATPANLYASANENSVTLTWDGVDEIGYGYIIYRDGLLYQMSQTNSFTDEDVNIGGYCYQVTVLSDGGESAATNEACATVGEGCGAPQNVWFDYSSNNKPIIKWETPEPAEGLTGYYIFRRTDDTDWVRIKLATPNATSSNDNSTLVDGTSYLYKVQAYYQDIECLSAPARNKYSDFDYFVRVHYSITGIEENAAEQVNLYPNPTKDKVTIKAEGMNTVSVFNLTGQKVMEVNVNADQVELNMNELESGIYMVRISGESFDTTKRISVVK